MQLVQKFYKIPPAQAGSRKSVCRLAHCFPRPRRRRRRTQRDPEILNARGMNGEAPLHRAARADATVAVRALLELGVDVCVQARALQGCRAKLRTPLVLPPRSWRCVPSPQMLSGASFVPLWNRSACMTLQERSDSLDVAQPRSLPNSWSLDDSIMTRGRLLSGRAFVLNH